MMFLKNQKIKNKIIIFNLVIAFTAMSVAVFIFTSFEVRHQKRTLLNNVKMDARIVVAAIYASLDFNYKKDAQNILSTMSVKPYLNDCIIFDKENNFFVSQTGKKYKKDSFNYFKDKQYTYSEHEFSYKSDILNLKKDKIGTIYYIVSSKIYKDRLSTFFTRIILLFLFVIILTFVLSSILHRVISAPILELSNVTKDIENKEDLNIEASYQSNDEIGILYKNFNKMIRALRDKETERNNAEKEQKKLQSQLLQSQKMEAIGQLAGGIAHDFNNILTAINGYADLALIKLKQDRVLSKMLEIIRESGRKAAGLTKQLLAFSRKQITEIKTVNLNTVIKGMEEILKRLIEEDTEISFDYREDCFIDTDKGQIEQIIMNLVVNARDAIRMNKNPAQKKIIKVQTSLVNISDHDSDELLSFGKGKYVLLSVSDTGIGMNLETKEKIFEPFFTTKPRDEGTGLGLATVYGIVKQNKGTINVYSELNMGTTFKIFWPLSDSVSDDADTVIESSKLVGGSEKILIVEDNKDVLSFTSKALSSIGYNVFEADCGETALKIVKEQNFEFDLIVSDVIMPGISGPEFVDKVTQINKNIKILFVSGYTFDLIVKNGIVEKNTNFISKPFSRKDLAKKIKTLLNG